MCRSFFGSAEIDNFMNFDSLKDSRYRKCLTKICLTFSMNLVRRLKSPAIVQSQDLQEMLAQNRNIVRTKEIPKKPTTNGMDDFLRNMSLEQVMCTRMMAIANKTYVSGKN